MKKLLFIVIAASFVLFSCKEEKRQYLVRKVAYCKTATDSIWIWSPKDGHLDTSDVEQVNAYVDSMLNTDEAKKMEQDCLDGHRREDSITESKLMKFSYETVEDKMEDHPKILARLRSNDLSDLGISVWKNPSGRVHDLGLWWEQANGEWDPQQKFVPDMTSIRIRFENTPARTYGVYHDYQTGMVWFYDNGVDEIIPIFKRQDISPENPLVFWIEVTRVGYGRDQFEFKLERPLKFKTN